MKLFNLKWYVQLPILTMIISIVVFSVFKLSEFFLIEDAKQNLVHLLTLEETIKISLIVGIVMGFIVTLGFQENKKSRIKFEILDQIEKDIYSNLDKDQMRFRIKEFRSKYYGDPYLSTIYKIFHAKYNESV